jgi:hypothetical protein
VQHAQGTTHQSRRDEERRDGFFGVANFVKFSRLRAWRALGEGVAQHGAFTFGACSPRALFRLFPFMCGSDWMRCIVTRNLNRWSMTRRRLACAGLLLAGSMLVLASPGIAQQHDHGPMGHGPGGHPSFQGSAHFAFAHHDFAHFTPGEHGTWTGGHWHHGWHSGRIGWWWFAGGAWYFYDAPVYPYPGYVSDYYVEDYGPPGQYWYYCPSPPGYYPYVQRCSAPWQPVPPSPPPGAGYGPQSDADNGAPPPAGYEGQDGGPGSGDQPPPGYQDQGPSDQPPPGDQGQGSDQPPPGYPGQGPGDPPPAGIQGQGPGDQPPAPQNGYNGPNGPN